MTDADLTQPSTTPAGRDHPDVLAVCRWLPQRYPWGAFTGRHDYVHVDGRHGRVNLWWADFCVHRGDYVGPPRGGLAPDPEADYDVAMPAGGYLHIRRGLLAGWSDDPGSDLLVRADGDVFRPTQYGPGHPYFQAHYRQMTVDDRLNALASIRSGRGGGAESDGPAAPKDLESAVAEWVGASDSPDQCSCTQPRNSEQRRGMDVPGTLLKHGGAVATLTGMGDTDTACDVIWSLTQALADPDSAGLVRAAETAARRAADSVAGWPDGPLTEEAVALVAAQAVRWHGSRIMADMPFWVLGWIFTAKPVLESVLPDLSQTERARLEREILAQADRVRVDRVIRTWRAAHRAGQLLESFSQAASDGSTVTAEAAVIDLRATQAEVPRQRADPPSAYVRSVASVVAELAQA